MVNIKELSKKRVLRTISGYAVACFVTLQIADVTFEPLSIDQSVLKTLIALMIIGFPIVSYLAWVFDTGPQLQIRKTSVRKVGLEVSIGVFCVTAFVLASWFIWTKNSEAPTSLLVESEPQKPAIAVLPFTNLGATENFFGAGVAEEILNRMLRFKGVSVISRHSSFNYGDSDRDIQAIGANLGADYVLRGSVRRSDNLVRVSVYLTEVTSGLEIWGNSYDRDMGEILALQDEITTLTINELLPTINVSFTSQHVVNPTAYELLLKARAAMAANDPLSAKPLLQSAVTLDPEFSAAFGALADVHESLRIFGSPDFVGDAELLKIVARALTLDPENVEARAVNAIHDLYVRNNPDEALRKFESLAGSTSSTRVLHHYRSLLIALDKPDELLDIAMRRKNLDPHSRITTLTEYWAHYVRGDFESARQAANRIPLEPVSENGWSGRRPWLLHLDLAERNYASAKRILAELGPGFHPEGKRYFQLWLALAENRDVARASYLSEPISISAMPFVTWLPFDIVLTGDVSKTIAEMENPTESRSIVWISQLKFRERWVRTHAAENFGEAFDLLKSKVSLNIAP